MRQVLVVVELRKAQLQLGKPMVDRVVAGRERLIGALNKEIMENLIVVAGRAVAHSGYNAIAFIRTGNATRTIASIRGSAMNRCA